MHLCCGRFFVEGFGNFLQIEGLHVTAPVISQFVMVVVVLLGHLRGLDMGRLVHVNYLHTTGVSPRYFGLPLPDFWRCLQLFLNNETLEAAAPVINQLVVVVVILLGRPRQG